VRRSGRLLSIGTAAELAKSDEPYVKQLLQTPRRQTERLKALLPESGIA